MKRIVSGLQVRIAILAGILLPLAGALPSGILDQWNWRNPYPNGNELNGVAYGSGTFVTVGGNGTIMSSNDGHSWTPRESGVIMNLNQVIYAEGSFVAVGEIGVILTSTNGVDWMNRSTSASLSLRGITFGQGRYLIVGSRLASFG